MRVLSLLAVLALLSVSLLSRAAAQTAGVSPAAIAAQADAQVLNFALTIERLDSTFWSCYLYPLNTSNPYCSYAVNVSYAFSQSDFATAGYNATVFQAVQLLAQEELAHASILNSTLQSLGFTPVPACLYQYPGITSVQSYLNQGLAFETVGTAAYAGGLNGVSSPALVQASATIATVEARHAGYLSNLLGQQPFASNGLNQVLNSTQVAALISPYYVNPSCLQLTPLPVVRPYGVTGENATDPTPYTGSQTQGAGFTYSAQAKANDLKTLNYALGLEALEATFYAQAATAFTAAQFTAAGYNASVPTFLSIIAANEALHVSLLTATIQAYGGVPVSNCSYNFSALGYSAFSSINNYLAYASAIESVGVQAYDGAANTLTDSFLLQTAGAIALIEARHVAFINALFYSGNQSMAFPSAVDATMTPAQVWSTIVSLGLITSCPFVNVSDANALAPLLPLVATPYPTTTGVSGATGAAANASTGVTAASATTGSSFSNFSSAATAATAVSVPSSTAPPTNYTGGAGMTAASKVVAGLTIAAAVALLL